MKQGWKQILSSSIVLVLNSASTKGESQDFKIEERTLFEKRWDIALLFMGFPLVLIYSCVDYFFRPDLFYEFLKIRLLVIPVTLFCYSFRKFEALSKHYYTLPAHVFSVFLSLYNTYLTSRSGFETSSYYAGLNLVAMGSFAFMPWRPFEMIIHVLVLYAPYYLSLFLKGENLDFSYFIPHSAFTVSTIFIGTVTGLHFRSMRKSEVILRKALKDELDTKELIIKRKTDEGIALSRLVRHFPPLVMESIKSGLLNLNEIQRKQVCIVFVDLKGSTERANRIDHTSFRAVLTDSLKGIRDVFIKNGLTIGQYMGDGMCCFSNAPMEQDNYQEVAIRACVEALVYCIRKKSIYEEQWRKPFSVRFGINTGYADVGFLPDAEFGHYTVIGDSVNQASRFCSVAAPNSICIPKSIIKNNASLFEGLEVTKLELKSELKGLEGEIIDLFTVQPFVKLADLKNKCPLCSSPLVLESELGNSVMIKCSSLCNYRDLVERSSFVSAKVA